MDKALLIKDLCGLLLDDRRQDCIDLVKENYPFVESSPQKRQYSKYQMCKIFLRDGFIDRYSGDKLLFPGLIKILTLEFPDIFKYHINWKMSKTHMIYWDLCPTIDHLIPVARGGQNNDLNLITTSMIRNSAKSNWTIEEIGWKLHEKGQLSNWDGLIHYFIDLTNKNQYYEQDSYVSSWKLALLRALNELKNDETLSKKLANKSKTTGTQKFHLRIYENSHYMDESEAYNHGEYNTYEDALIAAKEIVDDFFEHNWQIGMTPESLIGQYCLYGEDPIILPNEPGKHERFSARTYASISAVEICRRLDNQ